MGGTISSGKNNDELVDNLVDADFLKTLSLQRVFRAVDRGDYYTLEQREKAYRDSAWRNGNLHLSAPCVYSEVMEALKLKSGLSFLNLGSGSGYLSTMAGLILGPYGVNHGVELFSDVVTFANSKLDEFINNSDAIDEYEFCAPKFVVGNCLRIDSNAQLYDRVYCGASCPLEHEIYMKHLIKVGGILVMPLNNKLMQIKRTGEATWESNKVLSVSFAPLLPFETEPLNFVNLPDFTPPTLQEACRSLIRTVFRKHIDKEHPSLKNKKRNSPKNADRRHIRRIVIPLINRSESANSSDSDDDNSGGRPNPRMLGSSNTTSQAATFIENFVKERSQMSEILGGPSGSSRVLRSKTKELSEKNTQTEISGDEQFEVFLNSKGRKQSGNSADVFYAASFVSESKENGGSSSSSSVESAPSTSQRQPRKRKMSANQDTGKNKKNPRLKLRRQTATFIWKRIVPEEASEPPPPPKKGKAKAEAERKKNNYRNLMAEKVLALPLPTPLQRFLNYKRDNI